MGRPHAVEPAARTKEGPAGSAGGSPTAFHARAESFTARDARGESTTLLAAADRLNLDDGAHRFGIRILVFEYSIGEGSSPIRKR